jgi:hypothetical protein
MTRCILERPDARRSIHIMDGTNLIAVTFSLHAYIPKISLSSKVAKAMQAKSAKQFVNHKLVVSDFVHRQ